ncbi:NAD-dependent epimerase/dehydratase family protein [Saccharothrix coeruleofusca]|uniref:NAD-dependent dehydratase n=1 Tax=Saccharothrix coeruleofusca TaxID=33919 RepID=A0A918AHY7_9PSEU|nr:NAD(P)-dependent oxidoreductase [Saccharothrix coeruleofusca]MBP2334510.1 nucleoside-diphosphate-sugar epimerase [Saccharothrix coeruleofusca]GGP40514.1 NAD-dependent dehydratase [Saccharothrix coeruleofusca]
MTARILITGAAGGVGTLMRPRLAAPDRVLRLLDIAEMPPAAPGERVELVTASVTDQAAMEAACEGVDAVIHLGGHSLERPWAQILDVNIDGTHTVLEAARRRGVGRVVLASSNHAVGFHPRSRGEAGDYLFPRPDSYYGVSKVAMEALGSMYSSRYGLDVIAVRIGSCFEKPRDTRMLSTWLSPDDGARLFEACLSAPSPGFRVVWGVSDNTRRWFSLDEARALGYAPEDDSEVFAAELIAEQGEPDPESLAHKHVGGLWCGPEFDTAVQEAGR